MADIRETHPWVTYKVVVEVPVKGKTSTRDVVEAVKASINHDLPPLDVYKVGKLTIKAMLEAGGGTMPP